MSGRHQQPRSQQSRARLALHSGPAAPAGAALEPGASRRHDTLSPGGRSDGGMRAGSAPSAVTMGESIPGFKTSFNVSGKGGGAFKPISEDFSVNPATGTMRLALPIRPSPTRGGYGPELALSYDSGSGNGPFGFGWDISLPSVQRKTAGGIPKYHAAEEDDVVFCGSDIVRKTDRDTGTVVQRHEQGTWGDFDVTIYIQRVDVDSLRLEKWVLRADPTDVHWRTISANNETAIFGDTDASRIVDRNPSGGGGRRIFSWMISQSFDAHGNCIDYEYKQEDAEGVTGPDGAVPIWERNRSHEVRTRQKYIKRIRYGNKTSNRHPDTWRASQWPRDWMFSLVFDYGEHEDKNPTTAECLPWRLRQDVFSGGQAGFEVRTYRLCQRLLMFHHFPEQLGRADALVHAIALHYDESPQRSVVSRVVMRGHSAVEEGSGPQSAELPPWSFQYNTVPDPTQLASLEANVVNLLELPSTNDRVAEWLDLDGEGMPGLLTRSHDGAFYYQRNRGSGLAESEPQFQAPVALSEQPSFQGGNFVDLSQTGSLDYVVRDVDGSLLGFFERGESDTWSSFSTFAGTPKGESWKESLDIDLTGDGLADSLCVSDDNSALAWQQNLGKLGLSGWKHAGQDAESTSPRLSRSADTQTHVADMTGNGMADLVEISATAVRYWPNLGHGVFGSVVDMGCPPLLSAPLDFDTDRVRLIDVDGSGSADLLYLLPAGGARLYYNFCGNSWSDALFVPTLPSLAAPSSVFTLDILGKGTGCLCWADSSSGTHKIRYLDLAGGNKPHLLKGYSNGLGAETSVSYKPSTEFYIQDQRAGTPWSTRLPFPVHCVSKVSVKDHITQRQRTSEYIYHNGSFDSIEKQFSGFEMVEQLDREKVMIGVDEFYEQVPLLTKSWFSVGTSLTVDDSRFLTKPLVTSMLQDARGVPQRDQLFALRGAAVRIETYSPDGTEKSNLPFSVVESAYDVTPLQPRGPYGKYAVVRMTPRETLSKQYERSMQDPRVSHDLVLGTNSYGDVEKSLSVVYPRKGTTTGFADVDADHTAGLVTLSQAWHTEAVIEAYDFRKPLVWRQQDCEVRGLWIGEKLAVGPTRALDLEALPWESGPGPWKALQNETRAFFLDSTLGERLDEGKLQTHSVLDQTFSLAFTDDMLAKVDKGLQDCGVPGSAHCLMAEGKYVKLQGSDHWWMPSARSSFRDPNDSTASGPQTVEARRAFYVPFFFTDVFGNTSTVQMDENVLLVEQVQDALGNVTSFGNDYHRLQPTRITDANANSVQIVLDPLGRQLAFACIGKGGDNEVGACRLDGVIDDVDAAVVDAILSDPEGSLARGALGSAEGRTIHCTNQYALWHARQETQEVAGAAVKPGVTFPTRADPTPAFTITLTRDLPSHRVEIPQMRVAVTYLDGSGAEHQEFHLQDPNSVGEAWVLQALSMRDTQGHAICTYQPCFAASASATTAVSTHSSAKFAFCDALGRDIASLSADGTWTKTTHTPWATTEYDASGLITQSVPQDDVDVGFVFAKLPSTRLSHNWYDHRLRGTAQPDRRAAEKSAAYGSAPVVTHIGASGLPVRTARVIRGELYTRSFTYDVNGNRIEHADSYGRVVEKALYDGADRRLQSTGMDQGESWTLHDAAGGELLSWNCRGHSFQTRYDALRRETERLAGDGAKVPRCITRTWYGESCAGASERNLKQHVWKVEDQAGLHTSSRYDIRGRCLEQSFQATLEYKAVIDWRDGVALAPSVYTQAFVYDNFGQLVEETDAQGNRTRRQFNRHGQVCQVDFSGGAAEGWKPYLLDATFTADGLPLRVMYGNKVVTDYTYDDRSRYLNAQRTTRKIRGAREVFEDVTHVYDCEGRRVFTRDGSEQVKYFRESRIRPEWDYTYDATGALVAATGRAQIAARPDNPNQLQPYDAATGSSPTRGVADGNMLYQYLETYRYDREGNLLEMKHAAPGLRGVGGWTRTYHYEERSLLSADPKVMSNRLSRTSIGGKEEARYSYAGSAGLAGCMTSLPRFSELDWDMNRMLSFSSTQTVNEGTPERTYYTYDHLGNRVRKVTESSSKPGVAPQKLRESLYFGTLELQTRGDGSSLAIAQVKGDVVLALVEDSSKTNRKRLVRFRIADNSELDDEGQLVSFEEYSPFGSVVYSALLADVEAHRKYRFARYEHDRETGLSHCGLRYYCPWLGRWTSPDPLDDVDGPNLYEYVSSDPINYEDPSGTAKAKANTKPKTDGPRVKLKKATASDATADAGKKGASKKKTTAKKVVTVAVKRTKRLVGVVKDSLVSGLKAAFSALPACSLQATLASLEKVPAVPKKPHGDQHHIFQWAFGHFFDAADIAYNETTLFVDKDVHGEIGPKHDAGWLDYFVGKARALDASGTKDMAVQNIKTALTDPSSDLSKKLIEHFEWNQQNSQTEMRGVAASNMSKTGLHINYVEKSIAPYQVDYNKRGKLITWKGYQALKEKYKAEIRTGKKK